MADIFIRKYLDTKRDTRGAYALRAKHVKREQEDRHLESKKRSLRIFIYGTSIIDFQSPELGEKIGV